MQHLHALPLLAKSIKQKDSIPYAATLSGHLQQVVDAAEMIVDSAGEYILAAVGVEANLGEIKKILRVAAATHDLGKASVEFQRMIHNPSKKHSVTLRHELISDWLLFNHPGLHEALKLFFCEFAAYETWGRAALRMAITGHHLKLNDDRFRGYSYSDPIEICWAHPEFSLVQKLIENVFEQTIDWSSQPCLMTGRDWIYSFVKQPLIDFLEEKQYELTDRERQLCSVVRGLLIAADTLGSIGSQTRREWVEHWLSALGNALDCDTLQNGLQSLIQNVPITNVNPEITAFQDRVSTSHSRITLVEGGCGTGKTLAAYRWSQKIGRPFLFIMYPTTATATQGFHDYALSMGKQAQLRHSRSMVDMDFLGIEMDQEDGTEENEESRERIYEALERLHHPLTVCTADAVLGVMQNFRTSLLLLPVLVKSALVFDEIHSYDDMLSL